MMVETQNQTELYRQEVPVVIFDFLDTLIKIKSLSEVIAVNVANKMTDVYVVTKSDDLDLNDHITQLFAQWEACHHIFPELHIITDKERFYIPDGAMVV